MGVIPSRKKPIMARTSRVVLVVAALTLLGGCGATNGVGGAVVTQRPTVAATVDAAGCPDVSETQGSSVAVDYVDFVQANGRQYVADLGGARLSVGEAEVGAVQLRVRCSLSELNDRTHQTPPPARDGDAGFLPAGTPVHAVNGWSPLCRLTAEHDGSWRVYLALDEAASTARPRPCAVNPGG